MLSMRVVGIAEVAKTLKGIDNDLVKQARKDFYMSPTTALEYGLIDTIL